MSAKKAIVPPMRSAVRAFGAALSAARRVPIEIHGMYPPLVGHPRDRAELLPEWEGEDFPGIRLKHSYVFELHDGPLFLTVELCENGKHWRLFAFTDRRGQEAVGEMVFSLNLTLADDDEDELTLRQRLRMSTRGVSSEDRLAAANKLASRLLDLGLDVTPERDITFPTFKGRAGKFVGSSASAFIREFVITAVVKGHYMANKGYTLPGLDLVAQPVLAPRPLMPSLVAGAAGTFDPSNLADARERAMAEVVRRPGQAAFRQAVFQAYEGRCAVTGCDFSETIQAAHINPYLGTHSDHVENGLLLRVDIHVLFDNKRLAIDSGTMKILLAPALKGTKYKALEGKVVSVPKDPNLRPSRLALDKHRREAGL